jgi:hypothetical protein
MPTTKLFTDVWAVACPRCEAPVGRGCRDMRSRTGRLYGRRTHRERARRIREVGVTKVERRIWYSWAGTTGTATTGSWTIDPIWNTWNGTTTTGGNTITYAQDATWHRWEAADQQYRQATIAEIEELRRQAQERLDAEQRRREQNNARRLANMVRMEGAEDRAEALLLSLLTEEQTLEYINHQTITVRGSAGGLYKILARGQVHGNIRAIDVHGCFLGTLCVAPHMYTYDGALPMSDGYVGQLLAIRFNEPALLEKANWSGRRECQNMVVPIMRAA